jgi:hypothetical protein
MHRRTHDHITGQFTAADGVPPGDKKFMQFAGQRQGFSDRGSPGVVRPKNIPMANTPPDRAPHVQPAPPKPTGKPDAAATSSSGQSVSNSSLIVLTMASEQ